MNREINLFYIFTFNVYVISFIKLYIACDESKFFILFLNFVQYKKRLTFLLCERNFIFKFIVLHSLHK